MQGGIKDSRQEARHSKRKLGKQEREREQKIWKCSREKKKKTARKVRKDGERGRESEDECRVWK